MTEVGRPPSITSMRHVWERIAAVALTTFAVSGCTFGMLETNECLRLYRPGLMDAASQVRSRGSISQESFGYCVDGKRRAEAMLAPLREHGFTMNGPSKHFEVPGGWCLSASRPASAERFDPLLSLETACALGHASSAYLTGGTFQTADGQTHYIRSTYDSEAREQLEKTF